MDLYDFEALFTILSAERDIYAELLALAVQKARAVTNGDLEELDQILDREMALQVQKEGIAAERALLSEAIAPALGIAPGDATLRMIITAMPDKERAAAMEALRNDFSQVLRELSVQTEANQRLIQAQLKAIGATIEFMSRTAVVGNSYNRHGSSEDMLHRVNLLDTSV